MPKIKDQTTICWTDCNGKPITEEIITYEDEDEETLEEESIAASSVLTLDNLMTSEEFEDDEDSKIEKTMMTFVIDDLLENLAILRCTLQGEHAALPVKFTEYKSLDDRFGQIIELSDDKLSESKKRYADMNMIYSVFHKTLEEVSTTGSYAPLAEATHILKKTIEDDEKLILEDEESFIEEEELKKQLINQRKELENTRSEKLKQLRLLEEAHEDAIMYGKMELKYLQNWEKARLHQAKVIQERGENNYQDIIATNQTIINAEKRVHAELVKFFNENAEELTNETTYWMYRYENEMEAREGELLKLRMDRDAQMEKYMQLKATYESQKEFIDYWLRIKEEKRIAAVLLEKQNAAAKKIQGWWRYHMKRLRLGPYKKGKKGRKGDKKGGGKKKK